MSDVLGDTVGLPRRVPAVAALFLVVLLAGCGGGADGRLDADFSGELQRTLDEERKRWKIPGAAAAVIVDGEGEWAGASGKADLASGRALTHDTLFGIGSITKSFVAALLLDLAEDGVLSVDDKLSRWLPTYPRAAQITLRQLLNHTSGVPNFTESAEFGRTLLGRPFARLSPEWTLSIARGSDFAPGDGWRYSNTGYILLGLVVEEATGASVAEQLRRRILDPLELDSLVLQGEERVSRHYARAYGDEDGDGDRDPAPSGVTLIPTPAWATAAWTAGAMVGTAVDVARWADALFGGRVLERGSLRQMQTLVGFDYGLGVGKRVAPSGHDMWGHGGEIGGYRSEMWSVPELGVTVVTLWNDSTVSDDLIGQALLQVVLEQRLAAEAESN